MTDKREDKPDFIRIAFIVVMMLWITLLVALLFISKLRKDVIHVLIVLSVSLLIIYLGLTFESTDKLIEYFSKKEKLDTKFAKFETILFIAVIASSIFKDMVEFPLQGFVFVIAYIYLLLNWIIGKHLIRR